MKIITIQKIGWNHPSQANWSYGIWQITALDTTRDYCAGITAKEQFGGDSRFTDKARAAGFKVIELKSVYPLQKCTGIRDMQDLEAPDFLLSVTQLF